MTTGIPRYIAWHGVDQPPPQPRILRAGPLTVALDGMDLRYIRLGAQEILRRVYVAVRDPNWGTIPATYSNVRSAIGDDAFEIQFEAWHQDGEIDFAWEGRLRGDARGTINYAMDGEARRTFRKNRIGLCILHPMSCAGAACTVTHVDGSLEQGSFPREIAPHQPFLDFTAIAHEVGPGLHAEVRLDGDVFEMEDQRNWTDASFKTYSTPLRLPFPVEVAQGTRIAQSVTLSLQGAVPAVRAPVDDVVRVDVDRTVTSRLPTIGLGHASHGEPLREQEVALLRALRPAHLRVDLDLTAAYDETLRQAATEGQALGAPLELALFVSDEAARELAGLRDALRRDAPAVARVLVFHHGEAVTSARWVTLAREILGPHWPGVPVGGGSNAYFTQLNRARPPHGAFDVVSYSINPQVHAFDDTSLVETLPAQVATLDSARLFCGGAALAVDPVTLRPRFNPDATGAVAAPAPGTLPPQVDPRQMSLFGAGWTLGSIKYLAEGGASSVTYYETTGWRGVMETAHGSTLPAAFHSTPGMVFPLYHILTDVAEFAGGTVYRSGSSDPLAVEVLILGDGARTCILLANMTGQRQDVVVPWPGLHAARIRVLDEHSFEAATGESEAFRQQGERVEAAGDALRVALQPFAVARIDGDSGAEQPRA